MGLEQVGGCFWLYVSPPSCWYLPIMPEEWLTTPEHLSILRWSKGCIKKHHAFCCPIQELNTYGGLQSLSQVCDSASLTTSWILVPTIIKGHDVVAQLNGTTPLSFVDMGKSQHCHTLNPKATGSISELHPEGIIYQSFSNIHSCADILQLNKCGPPKLWGKKKKQASLRANWLRMSVTSDKHNKEKTSDI